MSSNCYNPFLYGWLNDAFRHEFLKLLPALATLCGNAGGGGAGGGAENGRGGGGDLRRRSEFAVENGAARVCMVRLKYWAKNPSIFRQGSSYNLFRPLLSKEYKRVFRSDQKLQISLTNNIAITEGAELHSVWSPVRRSCILRARCAAIFSDPRTLNRSHHSGSGLAGMRVDD